MVRSGSKSIPFTEAADHKGTTRTRALSVLSDRHTDIDQSAAAT